jgi:hypothetical protein
MRDIVPPLRFNRAKKRSVGPELDLNPVVPDSTLDGEISKNPESHNAAPIHFALAHPVATITHAIETAVIRLSMLVAPRSGAVGLFD